MYTISSKNIHRVEDSHLLGCYTVAAGEQFIVNIPRDCQTLRDEGSTLL
jgi:hypothetical protein